MTLSTKTRRRTAALIVVLGVVAAALVIDERLLPRLIRGVWLRGDGVFEVKPYLQLGDATGASAVGKESALLLWQTADRDDLWSIEVRSELGSGSGDKGRWAACGTPAWRRVAVEGVSPFRVYRAELAGLEPGEAFAYRVRRAGAAVFEATGRARKPAGRSHRFVVFGDCAAGTWAQGDVAYQTFKAAPDYVVVTGDVVYMRGRVSEYLDHFFPIYNNETPSRWWGAPLLRSTPFVTAAGNHDLIERDLDKQPDGLAFFYYWAPPLNGPVGPPGSAGFPALKGSPARQKAFLDAAGDAYPQSANFSFDYGDVHWTVLDANTYADWTDPRLRGWLEADLASAPARNAAWRVVAFHHPPFNSSKAHADDQRTRVLARVFEEGGVSIVFNGHVHNYQRTYPLRFAVGPPPADGAGTPYGPTGHVDGRWTLDKTFDGATNTRPDGVIYVVTGAGGARLYNVEQNDDPKSWQSFTARFVSNTHSLTIVDVTAGSLSVRQVSADGREIDNFRVTREVGGEEKERKEKEKEEGESEKKEEEKEQELTMRGAEPVSGEAAR